MTRTSGHKDDYRLLFEYLSTNSATRRLRVCNKLQTEQEVSICPYHTRIYVTQ